MSSKRIKVAVKYSAKLKKAPTEAETSGNSVIIKVRIGTIDAIQQNANSIKICIDLL